MWPAARVDGLGITGSSKTGGRWTSLARTGEVLHPDRMDDIARPGSEPVERLGPRTQRGPIGCSAALLREKQLVFLQSERDTVGLHRRLEASEVAQDNEATERLVRRLSAAWGA